MLGMSLQNAHDGQFVRNVADLVEVSGSQLPGLGGKVDVVAVMHLGQVVEAAGLHTPAAVVSLSVSRETNACASWHKAFVLMMACMASASCPKYDTTANAFSAKLHWSQNAVVWISQPGYKQATQMRRQWALARRDSRLQSKDVSVRRCSCC